MHRSLLVIAILLTACSKPAPEPTVAGEIADAAPPTAADQAHNSRNALDWAGTYSGTVPCADCEGIRTTIRLQADGSFVRERVYLGKSDDRLRDAGTFAWNEAGSIVTLDSESAQRQQYQVGENRLFHLDQAGKRIEGELADRYVLEKAPRDARLEGRKWLLAEIMGMAVDTSQVGLVAFIEFDGPGERISGNAFCNRFSGTYVLSAGNRIRFADDLIATMMACPDMSTEAAFLDALRSVDNYAIQGDTLSLHRARMAPLLRFKAAATL